MENFEVIKNQQAGIHPTGEDESNSSTTTSTTEKNDNNKVNNNDIDEELGNITTKRQPTPRLDTTTTTSNNNTSYPEDLRSPPSTCQDAIEMVQEEGGSTLDGSFVSVQIISAETNNNNNGTTTSSTTKKNPKTTFRASSILSDRSTNSKRKRRKSVTIMDPSSAHSTAATATAAPALSQTTSPPPDLGYESLSLDERHAAKMQREIAQQHAYDRYGMPQPEEHDDDAQSNASSKSSIVSYILEECNLRPPILNCLGLCFIVAGIVWASWQATQSTSYLTTESGQPMEAVVCSSQDAKINTSQLPASISLDQIQEVCQRKDEWQQPCSFALLYNFTLSNDKGDDDMPTTPTYFGVDVWQFAPSGPSCHDVSEQRRAEYVALTNMTIYYHPDEVALNYYTSIPTSSSTMAWVIGGITVALGFVFLYVGCFEHWCTPRAVTVGEIK